MTKTSVKNIFENYKYINILRVLDSYKAGLELKYLAYILIGEKKLIDTHYISDKTAEYAKIYLDLEKHKNKEYKLIGSNDTIKNQHRLIECLNILQKLKFVKKEGRKYKINQIVKDILIVKEDVSSLSHYRDLSHLIELKRNIISDSNISIYTSCEFVDAYNNSMEVKEEVDGIKRDMENLMIKVSTLSSKIHRIWREKAIEDFQRLLDEPESILGKIIRDNEKLAQAIKDTRNNIELRKGIRGDIEKQKEWMGVKPIVTVVMHSHALHSEEFHFNPVKPLTNSDGKLLVKGAYQTIEY